MRDDRDTIRQHASEKGKHSSADNTRRRLLTGGLAGLTAWVAGAGNAMASTAQPDTYPWQRQRGERFDDRVVLITGATSGIGEATARAFAAEGAKVMFCGRRKELGAKVAQSIRDAGGEARYVYADVREEELVKALVEECIEVYGGLDIAFNNAGIEGPQGSLAEIDVEGTMSYHDVMRTNLDGVFHAMRHELPVMRKQGHGVIANTASVLGSRGTPSGGAYSAAKHGVIGLTRSAALANAHQNLRIFTVSPGPVDTALLRRAYGDDLSAVRERNPSNRVAVPEEIAAAVLNLVGPDMAFLNGEDVKVDGGSSA